MQKLSIDDSAVHAPNPDAPASPTPEVVRVDAPVRRLNHKLIFALGGGVLGLLLVMFILTRPSKEQGEPTTDEDEAHVLSAQPDVSVEAMVKRARKADLEAELKAQERQSDTVTKDAQMREAMAQAVEQNEAQVEDPNDPWVKAREQAHQRNAQTYFQEAAGARRSGVFAQVGCLQTAPSQDRQGSSEGPRPSFEQRMAGPQVSPAQAPVTDNKQAFFANRTQRATRSFATLEVPMSVYEVQAGTVLNLVLETAIDSDLPGLIKARMVAPVYDTVTGQHLLIPSGAIVLGEYNASQGYGDQRVQVVWTRLMMPNGKSIALGNIPGMGLDGSSGVSDQVDEHWDRIIGSALLSSAIAAGGAAAAGNRDQYNINPGQQALLGAAEQVAETGQQLTQKNLEIQPTIRVRAGMRVAAFVREDLVLEPYQGGY